MQGMFTVANVRADCDCGLRAEMLAAGAVAELEAMPKWP